MLHLYTRMSSHSDASSPRADGHSSSTLDLLAALATERKQPEPKPPVAQPPNTRPKPQTVKRVPPACPVVQCVPVDLSSKPPLPPPPQLRLIDCQPVSEEDLQLTAPGKVELRILAQKPSSPSARTVEYRCAYCNVRKKSTSVGGDGRVRIRCECGGKRKDNIPRMHALYVNHPPI